MESINTMSIENKKLFTHVGFLIVVLFAFVVTLLILAPYTAVAETSCDYTYSTNGIPAVATITGYTGQGGSITIPNTLDGYPIVGIGNNSFAGCLTLTSVTIPDSVTSIGNNSFWECLFLTSVNIPDSVTSIGNNSFGGCSALTSIDVDPCNHDYASVDGVLYDKAITTLIQYPGGKAGAFTIPSGVISIRDWAFLYCTSLTSVTIPETVTSVGNWTFFGCTSMISVNIPDSVTSIGDWGFYYCGLTVISLGNGVISIGDYAFGQCESLTSVYISRSVESIGVYAFGYSFALTSIDVDPCNHDYASVDGVLYDKAITTLIWYPGGKAGAFIIPYGVISIGDSAFELCSSLTSITIPGSVIYIGNFAFTHCTSLTSVTIPSSVIYIGAYSFYYCGLTNVTMGNGVISIGDYAFGQCGSLTSISFLGLIAPTNVGSYWIDGTPIVIRGHAYAASDFPGLGEVWNGLVMGDIIQVEPGTPTGVVAISGNTQAVLNWTAPCSTGGSAITGYKIYRGRSSGGETLLITLGNVLTYTDVGLTNGQIYYYKVGAMNSVGQGPNSTSVNATPFAEMTLPSAPQNTSAVSGNNFVVLTWEAPVNIGNPTFACYEIFRRASNGSISVSRIGQVAAGTLTYNDTTAVNGTTYVYVVKAINTLGASPASDTVQGSPLLVTAGTSHTYCVKTVNEIGTGAASTPQTATAAISGGGTTDNSLLYAGIGIGVTIPAILAIFMLMRRRK